MMYLEWQTHLKRDLTNNKRIYNTIIDDRVTEAENP